MCLQDVRQRLTSHMEDSVLSICTGNKFNKKKYFKLEACTRILTAQTLVYVLLRNRNRTEYVGIHIELNH